MDSWYQQQQQQQQEEPPIHPPGVSDPSTAAPEGVAAAAAALQQWDQPPTEYGNPGSVPDPSALGFNSAPPVSQPPELFGSESVTKPLRGGARGRSLRGKGRNHNNGGSRSMSSSSNTEASRQEVGPSTENLDKKSNSKLPPGGARCELCNADCTSLENLEQHKLGKKHNKNLKKMEKPNYFDAIVNKVENENTTTTLQSENLPQVEENKPSQTLVEENHQKNELGNSAEPVELRDDLQAKKRGVMHGIRGGRGGKRMRTVGPPGRGTEPSRPNVMIPLMCDLCNVICNTQDVLDRHLSGKKHMSKLKRFEGHQAMYGPEGLQVLYPPNPITQTLLQSNGLQQGPSVAQQSSDPSAGDTQYTAA